MGRRKKGNPMKWWGFYSADELKEETKQLAEKVDENDSEYIRKAVEERNKFVKKLADKMNKKAGKEKTID